MTALTITCPKRVSHTPHTTCGLAAEWPSERVVAGIMFDLSPRANGDPICPMTGTTNCNGADATRCPAC
jgi:hypothetical protein